jgi:hypothetical protein
MGWSFSYRRIIHAEAGQAPDVRCSRVTFRRGREQRHLAPFVAAVRAMRVRVEQFPDDEPAGRFLGRHLDATGLGRGHGLRPFCRWILAKSCPR